MADICKYLLFSKFEWLKFILQLSSQLLILAPIFDFSLKHTKIMCRGDLFISLFALVIVEFVNIID